MDLLLLLWLNCLFQFIPRNKIYTSYHYLLSEGKGQTSIGTQHLIFDFLIVPPSEHYLMLYL